MFCKIAEIWHMIKVLVFEVTKILFSTVFPNYRKYFLSGYIVKIILMAAPIESKISVYSFVNFLLTGM